MTDKEVKFSHDYDKRHRDIIPTVRSKDYMEEHNIKLNDYVTMIFPTNVFRARLIAYEDQMIKDLELSFVKYDCAPLKCDDLLDYLVLLDSFAKYPCHQPTTIKRILWFKKVRGLEV